MQYTTPKPSSIKKSVKKSAYKSAKKATPYKSARKATLAKSVSKASPYKSARKAVKSPVAPAAPAPLPPRKPSARAATAAKKVEAPAPVVKPGTSRTDASTHLPTHPYLMEEKSSSRDGSHVPHPCRSAAVCRAARG